MNRHTIWTRYYRPREFHRYFATRFSLSSYRALSLFLPPPYLPDYYLRRRRWCDRLGRLDDRIGQWPLLRGMGDQFLMGMRRRSARDRDPATADLSLHAPATGPPAPTPPDPPPPPPARSGPGPRPPHPPPHHDS